MIITAPLRIDLCGGVTDIPEIAAEVGTQITNLGVRVYEDKQHRIERAVEVEVTPDATGRHALQVNGVEVPLDRPSGDLELLRRTAAHLLDGARPTEPVSIAVRNTLPRGTGLGGSAVVSSCIFAALHAWANGGDLEGPDSLIARAHAFETEVMGIAGGFQDYVGTYFGNTNRIAFTGLREVNLARNDQLGVEPVPEFRRIIDESLLLVVATERNQNSGDIVDDEVARFQADRGAYRDALSAMHRHNRLLGAMAMGELEPNPAVVGASMQQTWEIQKKLSPMVGALLAGLEDRVRQLVYGVHGPGAGGNSLALLAKPGSRDALADMLAATPETMILYPRISPGIEVRA